MLQSTSSMARYRASLGNVESLRAEQEASLSRRYQAGDISAGHQLVEASLPFVIRIAREYRFWGVQLEDLVQQGNIGLLRAAAKFEPERGCKLVTYASYWIRAEIRDYVMREYRSVRLGHTRSERKAIRAFRKGGIESPEQLAEHSGMPLVRARKLWPLLQRGDHRIDNPFSTVGSSMVDNSIPADPERAVAIRQRQARAEKAVQRALGKLPGREARIVEARLMSDAPATLEALGDEFGVSKERVRQLEVRARKQLKVALSEFAPAA